LRKYGLDYCNNLIGQGNDGTPKMSGKHGGVAAIIKEIATKALYVHCHAHRLNLVLVDTVAEIFTLLEKLYVSGSYVHALWVQTQKDMYKV
jgi:hypothetical protein